MRAALLLAAMLLASAAVWVAIGASLGPLTRTCAPELEPGACEAAVDAVMRRGTPALHPLILSALVEPGGAAGADELGHRATVTYELAAVPTTAEVELYFDQGAHWGGHPDPSEAMMSAMALEPLLLAAIIGGIVLLVAWRRRPKPDS